MYTVSETSPPLLPPYAEYCERSCNPFDMPPFGKATSNANTGWLMVDWIENPIGFIPDGTTTDVGPETVELVGTFFGDGRTFAYYPSTSDATKVRHTTDPYFKYVERFRYTKP